MSFVDVLRQARAGRTAVLHEFWTNYNPNGLRVHAFFEGHADRIFFKRFIESYLNGRYELYTYRCEGKDRVYDAFHDITARRPDCRLVIFFVDKDVDDVLGTVWPTDPRIFVTEVYSIENYLVNRQLLNRIIDDLVRFRDFRISSDVILDEFDRQLSKFYLRIIPLMGWIVFLRRSGRRPNLADINLKRWVGINRDRGVFCHRRRMEYLDSVAGIPIPKNCFNQLMATTRELSRLPPKRIIRGKFEMWFFVEFIKTMVQNLNSEASLTGGAVKLLSPLELSNAVEVLASRGEAPRSLELFLKQHFLPVDPYQQPSLPTVRPTLLRRVCQRFVKLLRS